MVHTKEQKHGPLRSMTLIVFGSSLFWVRGFLCYLSPVMFPPGSSVESSIGIEYGFFASQAGAALFAASIVVISHWRRWRIARIVFFIAALLTSLSAFALAYSLQISAWWLTVVCGIIDGICVPLLGIAWGTRFSLRPKSILPLVVLSFLIAYLLYYAVSPLPYEIAVSLVVLMPLISWMLWNNDARLRHEITSEVFSTKGREDIPAMPGEFLAGTWEARIMPWRSLAIFLTAAFVGNLITSFILGQGYSGVDTLFYGGVFVCACVATMSLTILAARKNSLTVSDFYRITLAFTAIGLICILVFGIPGLEIGGAFVQGGALFLQVIIILAVIQSTQETGISPLLSFSVGQGVIAAVVFVANILGKYLYHLFETDLLVLDILCGCGLLALFFMLVARAGTDRRQENPESPDAVGGGLGANGSAIEYPGSPRTAECSAGSKAAENLKDIRAAKNPGCPRTAESHPAASRAEHISAIAARYGLTNREAEILEYLAKGRSLPYIADTLFVTTGTIKTHTLNIYRKLGVNSKQELIDLVGI